jgi:hypothetical protein
VQAGSTPARLGADVSPRKAPHRGKSPFRHCDGVTVTVLAAVHGHVGFHGGTCGQSPGPKPRTRPRRV